MFTDICQVYSLQVQVGPFDQVSPRTFQRPTCKEITGRCPEKVVIKSQAKDCGSPGHGLVSQRENTDKAIRCPYICSTSHLSQFPHFQVVLETEKRHRGD